MPVRLSGLWILLDSDTNPLRVARCIAKDLRLL